MLSKTLEFHYYIFLLKSAFIDLEEQKKLHMSPSVIIQHHYLMMNGYSPL